MEVKYCQPTKSKNCHLCENSFMKDISFEEDGFPDFVEICSIDNHYIGYPDDACNESCLSFSSKDLDA